MNRYYKKFLENSNQVANDLVHRKTIKFNMSKYDFAVENGKKRFLNLESAKSFISARKRKALGNLYDNLINFEREITKRGANVLWAQNSKSAESLILQILKENNSTLVVKSKSMTTEEIDFNHFVENQKIQSVETDLGEYIVQIAGEKPYHIVTPAMHKSKRDVNKLFNDKFGLDLNLTAEELTNFVRVKLRNLYQEADIGVTGANFIIADQGAIAVTENEGNAVMSTAFPKIHIVIAGIEKIIPTIKDLGRFWPLLSSHGTGQAITVYNSIFFGPKKINEEFGPEKMYVILLDNKRTHLLKQTRQSDSLACIRCGACLNACPIYRNIGGYTYKSTYGGPIGSVLSPFFHSFEEFGHLSFACSICGKCTEVCPQKIDLHMILLHNRNKDIEKFQKNSGYRYFMQLFKKVVLNRTLFDFGPVGFKNFFLKYFAKNVFDKKRSLPPLKKSFGKSFKAITK